MIALSFLMTTFLDGFLFSKDRYKLFVLARLLLLAIWSMFTGTLTLKSTAADLSVSGISSSNPDDLDILEVADREKMVKNMWNAYIHEFGISGNKIRLPKFYKDAFQAAYESLISDSSSVRDDAFLEISKMSLSSPDLLPPPTQSIVYSRSGDGRRLSLKCGRIITASMLEILENHLL